MAQFVAGRGDPSELGYDVVVDRCLGAAILSARELPAPRSTSYEVRRVALDLADGRSLEVFHKNFDVSPHAPDVALARGRRERYVYEEILAQLGLGTPELYGVVWDDPSSRHWLLLEFVASQKPDYEGRIAAAGWLARLRGAIAGRTAELAQEGFLLAYDDAYFRDTAERAMQAVASRFGSLARRLEAVVSSYDAVIEKICSDEPTFVHGSYRRKNILVDTSCTPTRICPADWELAAIGPAMYDLAFLADGRDRPEIEHLCDTYAAQAAAFGLAVVGTEELLERLDCVRLHKALRSLARSADWAYQHDVVSKLVARAEKIRCSLC